MLKINNFTVGNNSSRIPIKSLIKLRWGVLQDGLFSFVLRANLGSHSGRAIDWKWRKGEKKTFEEG